MNDPIDETIYALPGMGLTALSVNRYWRARTDARTIADARAYHLEINPEPRDIVVWLDAGFATVPLYGRVNLAAFGSACPACLSTPCRCAAAVRRIDADPVLSGDMTADELARFGDTQTRIYG